MTDPTAMPPTPPAAPGPAAGAVPPAPPAGVVPPPPPSPRTGLIVGLAVGGSVLLLLLIAGVVAGALALSSLVSRQIEASVDEPVGPEDPFGSPDDLLEGEPGSPAPESPLDCDDCFDALDTREVPLPEAAYRELGLPDSDETWGSGSVQGEHRTVLGEWRDGDASPDECFPIYPAAPLPPSATAPSDDFGTVYYAPYHSSTDGYSSVTEVIRLFDSSAEAEAYLEAFDAALAECDQYSIPGAGVASRVTPAPALEVPDDMAAIAWVETSGAYRYYAVDLLRGNLVVRIAMAPDLDVISETQFREFVEEYAANIGDIPVR